MDFDPIPEQTYTGAAIEPAVTMKYNGAACELGTDFTVVYADNVEVGTGRALVTGIGNFTGTKELSFQIVAPAPVVEVVHITRPSVIYGLVYTGTEQDGFDVIDPRLTVEGVTSATDADDYYVATFKLPADTAEYDYRWAGDNSKDDFTTHWSIGPRWVTDDAVTFAAIPDQPYTGGEIRPPVTMMLNGVTCTPDVDYEVSYFYNVLVGTGQAMVVGKGNFTGSTTLEFEIKAVVPGEAVVTFEPMGGVVAESSRIVTSGAPWLARTSPTRWWTWASTFRSPAR